MKQLFLKHFHWFSRKLKSDSVDSFAAQVAFFTIIAFIPFVLFLLSLLQSVNINGTSLLQAAMRFLPREAGDFLTQVLTEQREPVALLSVAALTCLWSSSKAMLALIKGMNSVFDVDESRNFIRLRVVSVGYTVVFAVMLAATAVILVFGNTICENLLQGIDPGVSQNFMQLKSVFGFLLLFVFFTLSYKIVPRKARTPLAHCAVGGAFSSAGWVLFSYFFSIFVENFSNYSGMYGSLAALVILMLWLYFCMYITFLGGEAAVWLKIGEIGRDIHLLKKNWHKPKIR